MKIPHMKKLYFLILFLCFYSLNAQVVIIPDAIFKAKLLSSSPSNQIAKDLNDKWFKIDANNDGEIQTSEALAVSYLKINNTRTASLNGINDFSNLTYLDCQSNLLASLDVTNLKKLTKLDCGYNYISNLNVNGLTSLENLNCRANKLQTLDISSLKGLKIFSCASNTIEALDVTNLTALTELYCNFNSITSLNLNGLINLVQLSCGNNKISKLDISNLVNLVSFASPSNTISTLKIGNLPKLQTFYFPENNMSSLDLSGLVNLKSLYCGYNSLSSLKLNNLKELEYISCDHNYISSIEFDKLTKVVTFACYNNYLKTLDVSNLINLQNLSCYYNQLTYLNVKNGQNEPYLAFDGNPNLLYICADDGQTTEIQKSLAEFQNTKCTVNSYCSFTPGGIYYTIQGNGRFDWNDNGCDISDPVWSNMFLKVTDLSGKLITYSIADQRGLYSTYLPLGSYKVTPILENSSYFKTVPENFDISFPESASPYNLDFCLNILNPKSDLEVVIIPVIPARPGFDAKYKIVYKNKGNTTLSGVVNLGFDDSVLDLISANPKVSGEKINNASWNFTNLKPFETKEITVIFNVNTPTETPAINIGDILKFNVSIKSENIDVTPLDNTFAFNQTVVGSYDPNDKTCLEGSVITSRLIGEYVHYMIRFENTGTYTAQNIVVKDMIDLSKFDISTLVPTSSSHPFVAKISEENKVEFIFEKINLPFDDANNDGYIAFKIKTKPTLIVGDTFTNEANIYFDYNFPILTKKATSKFEETLGLSDFVFSNYLALYPNPVSDILNVAVKQDIEIQSLAIYDILGQLVIAVPNAKSVSTIDVSKLRTGTYFIKVKSDKGSSSMKFIKN
jgi:Leucine-rich repeat (LRR) protein